jgi:hypothetical protein
LDGITGVEKADQYIIFSQPRNYAIKKQPRLLFYCKVKTKILVHYSFYLLQ